jgi:hypothetical protein
VEFTLVENWQKLELKSRIYSGNLKSGNRKTESGKLEFESGN